MLHDPDSFTELYRRHEDAVLRRCMARVRSPELAADLTAETFASALLSPLDPSRESEAAWLMRLADAELARAYRTGTVATGARARLRIGPVVVDDRTLDRVWALRGPDRDLAPRPGASGEIEVVRRCDTDAAPVILAGLELALLAAVTRRQDRHRRRRRVLLGARVAAAVLSVGWLVGQAVLPERPASAVASETWLPFTRPGVEGYYPRSWFVAFGAVAPRGGAELVTVTTFVTGDGSDSDCGALRTLGSADALVTVYRHADRRSIEAHARRCAPTAEVAWRDDALIVFGRSAGRRARENADRFLARLVVTRP